jgi:hypothetical protein
MTTVQHEIAALKRENAELNRRLVRLEHRIFPSLAEPEQQVRITQTSNVNTYFTEPTPDELVVLHRAARAQFPKIVARDEDFATAHQGFAAAFKWLSSVGRTSKISNTRGLLEWCQDGYAWLRSQGARSSHFTGPDLCLAAAAHGDVLMDVANYPSVGFGLAQHGGGVMPTDAWRKTLEKASAA